MKLLTLKTLGGTQISPDGKWIAYTLSNGDFKQDAFVTQTWLVEVSSGRKFQLTRGDKSAGNPGWSPNGEWLAFLSNRLEDKNQIFAINPFGGEAVQLTKSETTISNYSWSEDGQTILYAATEAVPQISKDRKEYMGDYEVVRKEYSFLHLWTVNVADALNAPLIGKQRTKKRILAWGRLPGRPMGRRSPLARPSIPTWFKGSLLTSTCSRSQTIPSRN